MMKKEREKQKLKKTRKKKDDCTPTLATWKNITT